MNRGLLSPIRQRWNSANVAYILRFWSSSCNLINLVRDFCILKSLDITFKLRLFTQSFNLRLRVARSDVIILYKQTPNQNNKFRAIEKIIYIIDQHLYNLITSNRWRINFSICQFLLKCIYRNWRVGCYTMVLRWFLNLFLHINSLMSYRWNNDLWNSDALA